MESPYEHEMADPPAWAPPSNIFIMNCVFKALAKVRRVFAWRPLGRLTSDCLRLSTRRCIILETSKWIFCVVLSWVTKKRVHTVLFIKKVPPLCHYFDKEIATRPHCAMQLPDSPHILVALFLLGTVVETWDLESLAVELMAVTDCQFGQVTVV